MRFVRPRSSARYWRGTGRIGTETSGPRRKTVRRVGNAPYTNLFVRYFANRFPQCRNYYRAYNIYDIDSGSLFDGTFENVGPYFWGGRKSPNKFSSVSDSDLTHSAVSARRRTAEQVESEWKLRPPSKIVRHVEIASQCSSQSC